jgi:hypothetical protein
MTGTGGHSWRRTGREPNLFGRGRLWSWRCGDCATSVVSATRPGDRNGSVVVHVRDHWRETGTPGRCIDALAGAVHSS